MSGVMSVLGWRPAGSGGLNQSQGGGSDISDWFTVNANSGLTIDAIGDLLGYNGANFVKVPVGADDTALIADSSDPAGLAYSTVKLKDAEVHCESINKLSNGVQHIGFDTNQIVKKFNTQVGSDGTRP